MGVFVNRVILLGIVDGEPEVRYLDEGRQLARIRLRTEQPYTTAEGEVRTAREWHDVVSWGNLALRVQLEVHDDDLVMVEGALRHHKWQDSRGGQHHDVEVAAEQLQVLTPKEEAVVNAPRQVATGTAGVDTHSRGLGEPDNKVPPVIDDDLPF